MADLPVLPLELIFHIISSLVGDPGTILHPSDSATKALLSFTLVSRATYPVASNYLRKNCVYIDNDIRLRHLIHCVEATRDHHHTLSSSDNNQAALLTPSPTPRLHPLTALYLGPFTRTIDNQPTAIWVRELFCLVHPTLRRLAVDMPLRSLYPADDHLSVRATLREAFAMLRALEEFASVRDELFLDVLEPEWRAGRGGEPAVWESWPRLRRLALESVAAGEDFWRAVAAKRGAGEPGARPAGLSAACARPAVAGLGGGLGAEGAVELPRPLKVVVAGFPYNLQTSRWAGRRNWDRIDRDNIMKVMTYDAPDSVYDGENLLDRYYEWVKTAALNGDIWDWEGPLVMGTPKAEESTDAVVFELEA
ncbi:hypothetical protein VM1G_02001 [Cytospora mali]|uniref:Uncharacterized protein n=1 Tax=Cytospora mali TaxID=578113 RepID=A0A194VSR9_CYTMA|nr:hypothetical protein VM1G_02001 [Valsa mali]